MKAKVTFNKADLSKPESRKILVSILGDSKHGGFMRIHGFESKSGHGEIQDTTYCKGISYANAVQKSLEILDGIQTNHDFSVTVTRGVWANADGEVSPTGRKNKDYPNAETRTETYDQSSPILQEAFGKLRISLIAPQAPTKEYAKLGNGVYEDQETGTLYVRDLRLVKKDIVKHGNYPHKAGAEVNAVRDAIQKDMPVGNYRMFRLDATFDKVSLGGIELNPEPEQAIEGKVEAKKREVTETAETAKTAKIS